MRNVILTVSTVLTLVVSTVGGARAGSVGPSPSARADRGGKIGLLISLAGVGARVAEVLPDTPAARAGLRAGDLIVAVEGASLAGLDLGAMIKHIVGPTGTKVKLTIRRRGSRSTVTLRRAAIGKLYNDALREPKVAKLVRAIVAKQGGRGAILAIRSLSVVAGRKRRRWRASISALGYSFARCGGPGSGFAGGRVKGRRWGRLPSESPRRQVIERMQQRPYRLLPNLTAADFADQAFRLQYLGVVRLRPPGWVAFATPRRVHRFEFEAETFDFEPRSLRLVRHRRAGGQQVFFSGQRRFSRLIVPARWSMESGSYRLLKVSTATIAAARFAAARGADCRL